MEQFIPVVNQLISSLTLGGQIIIAILIATFLLRGRNGGAVELIEKYGLHFIFLASLGATVVSLFYSNFANYAPCDLCWWQRVFMYAIFFISGLALFKKDDETIMDYILMLATLGGLVAFYNSYLQYGGAPLIPCAANAEAISCSQRFVFEYNYITIPLMSLTGFILVVVIATIKRAMNSEGK